MIMKHIKLFENYIHESISGYDYKEFIKTNGKIKFPKWITKMRKEIVKEGLMDKVYDDDRFNMSIWINSLGKSFYEINANSVKREKEFGKNGSKFVDRFYHDITGYTGISWEAAMITLQLIYYIKDLQINDEVIEPSYYLAKEYFNNHDIIIKNSRLFTGVDKKLAEWMKVNNIETL